ncbi:MAG: 30S ribosomal protein S6 [Helicobacteraceae bacterium]|nr:30S ribosomal protein S6 [Helicobacteraceae bacterium]
MRHYENLVIVKPTLTEEEIQAKLAEIAEIITSNGGEIIARDDMGMRKLAYPIDKNARGYYHVFYYTIDPASIMEIERRFRINEELLRFVTMKFDTKREVKAWTDLVEATNKRAKASAKTVEAPAATEAPAAEEAPVATEVPATTEEVVAS